MTYCEFASSDIAGEAHRAYHDHAYGFPLDSDDELFGRLLLEINQAGLSWTTILNKQENFRRAYAGFRIAEVAAFGEIERQRLLGDAGIIRNRLKVNAAIVNAQRLLAIQATYGSFQNWLRQHQKEGLDREAWTKLFRKTFLFTGGEIVNEFLVSTGWLGGAHDATCRRYQASLAARKNANLA